MGIPDPMDVSLSRLWELGVDREAWRAAAHGVTKSRTRLSEGTERMCKIDSSWEAAINTRSPALCSTMT